MAELEHLQNLNPPQREAVEHKNGPLLILAGAGSGKTRVLTRRVAHLLHEGVWASRILAVTFTNKAAAEMRERVVELVGDEARRLWVSTFHSSCARILRIEAEALGYTKQFVIYDTDDQLRLMKSVLADLELDPKRHPPRGYLGLIDQAKNKLWGPQQLSESELSQPPMMDRVFRAYERGLKQQNALDFNDLIGRTVTLFRQNAEVLEKWQDRFRYLMVDEYQDTNRAQYELVKLLSAKRRNLVVVGDDDQSIYSFRGADIQNILDFEKDFPEAKVVVLDQNYRSTGNILRAAGAVVKNNTGRKEKELWTDTPAGDPIRVVTSPDEDTEAKLVIAGIARKIREGRSPKELAVIYRTNARSRPLEKELKDRHIPYKLIGARRFYDRKVVKDLLAYLRLLVNPADEMSLMRVINTPSRGLGPKAIEVLKREARQRGIPMLEATAIVGQGSSKRARAFARFHENIVGWRRALHQLEPGELVARVAEESGYGEMLRAQGEEGRGDLELLEELARDVAGDLADGDEDAAVRLQEFLDRAALASQADEVDSDEGSVTLLTAHLAKGLEFPVVYVVALVEGAFPHSRASEREEDIEEERRLAYVAFTRAMQELHLSWHRKRRNYGQGFENVGPSRFLKELPPEVLERRLEAPRRRPHNPYESRHRQLGFLSRERSRPAPPPARPAEPDEIIASREPESERDFRPGVKILHPDLGVGTIQQVPRSGLGLKLKVYFPGIGVKVLFPQYTRLEIVLG